MQPKPPIRPPPAKSSLELMREYGIEEFEMEYMDSDYETLTNYKLFCDDIRGKNNG